jgi:hypothetical protein
MSRVEHCEEPSIRPHYEFMLLGHRTLILWVCMILAQIPCLFSGQIVFLKI